MRNIAWWNTTREFCPKKNGTSYKIPTRFGELWIIRVNEYYKRVLKKKCEPIALINCNNMTKLIDYAFTFVNMKLAFGPKWGHHMSKLNVCAVPWEPLWLCIFILVHYWRNPVEFLITCKIHLTIILWGQKWMCLLDLMDTHDARMNECKQTLCVLHRAPLTP